MAENGSSARNATPDLDLPAGMFRAGDVVGTTTIQMDHKPFGLEFVKVTFTDIEGAAYYEGDIVLGPTDTVRGVDNPGPRGIGVRKEWRWKTHEIPVIVQEAVRPRVEQAIAHWEQRTPFRFIPRTAAHTDFLSFEAGSGCSSQVGRRGNKQVITLGPNCTVGSCIHEIGHSLGLWHEQSRSDRDQFIDIVIENVHPRARHNFDKHVLDAEDLGKYDYGSIMHYPATAFAIDPSKPTIKVKETGAEIGQRNGLSEGDIAAIREMYPDLNWAAVQAAPRPVGAGET